MPTYSFLDVTATLVAAGASIDLGAGASVAEEGIEINPVGDKNTMTIGADGEGMHSLHADKSGNVIFRFLKTSPVNAKLMALYDAQSLSSLLWGTNLIRISNPTVGDIAAARSCAFKRRPNLKYAKDADIVEWHFDAIKTDIILGEYS